MKRLLPFILISVTLGFSFIYFSKDVAAQGTCQACIDSTTAACSVTTNNCSSGYTCPAVDGTFTCPGVSTTCPTTTTLTCVSSSASTPPSPPTTTCQYCRDALFGQTGGACEARNNSCSPASACPVPIGVACTDTIPDCYQDPLTFPTVNCTAPPPTSVTGSYYCTDTFSSCSSYPLLSDPCKSGYVPGPCSGTWPNCDPQVASPAQCVAAPPPLPPATVGGLVVGGAPSNIVSLKLCDPLPFAGVNQGIQTGLGCVPTTIGGIFPWLLKLLVLVAGGIALLIIMYGGIMFITAGGDSKAIDEARSVITAGVSGLLLIVFSVLIFRVIGIDILGIPILSTTGAPSGGINVPGN